MNLGAKIFLAFFIFTAGLLGSALYFTNQQSESHEIQRITKDLGVAQIRFQATLESQQKRVMHLVHAISLDQKFRSFLQQIKDNFYSFSEELAQDSGGEIVFMVDETSKLRGVYPSDEKTHQWFEKNKNSFSLTRALDQGVEYSHILPLQDELFSIVYIPLKESLSDDYGVGVLGVLTRIDDNWLNATIGLMMKTTRIHAALFSGNNQVAGNVPEGLSKIALENMGTTQGETRVFLFSEERHLARQGMFEEGNLSARYLLTSNLDAALEPFMALQKKILAMGLLVLAIGLVFAVIFANRIVRPLRDLVAGTREVLLGNYDFRIACKSRDEVGKLSNAFNQMMEGLREKEHIRESFGKYLNPKIVSEIIENPDKLKLGGTRQVQTVLFSDIANFTSFSETMSPDELVQLLNKYLGAMTEELTSREGILDKYIGDAVMAFWGPPFTKGNHAILACQTALQMQKRLELLRAQWVEEGLPEVHARIGLATGEMIVGNIGSETARDYTCLGDRVNYGSRLEGLNKFYGTKILIDENTLSLAKDQIVARELDWVQVKGRKEGSPIYELMGLKDDLTEETKKAEDQETLIKKYSLALSKYREGDFEEARRKFTGILNDHPNDPPSEVMRQRCLEYIENPPAHWTGIHEMKDK